VSVQFSSVIPYLTVDLLNQKLSHHYFCQVLVFMCFWVPIYSAYGTDWHADGRARSALRPV